MDCLGCRSNCQSSGGLAEWTVAVLMRPALGAPPGHLTSFACTLSFILHPSWFLRRGPTFRTPALRASLRRDPRGPYDPAQCLSHKAGITYLIGIIATFLSGSPAYDRINNRTSAPTSHQPGCREEGQPFVSIGVRVDRRGQRESNGICH